MAIKNFEIAAGSVCPSPIAATASPLPAGGHDHNEEFVWNKIQTREKLDSGISQRWSLNVKKSNDSLVVHEPVHDTLSGKADATLHIVLHDPEGQVL